MDGAMRWIARAIILLFAGLTLWVGYWAVFAGPGLYEHPLNPRSGGATLSLSHDDDGSGR